MAITYLSGQRVQGSSTGAKTADATDDFTSNNWLEQDDTYIGVDTSTKQMDFNMQRNSIWAGVTLDLQNASYGIGETPSNTAWVLRYKFRLSTNTANGGSIWWTGLTEHPSSTNIDQTGDSIVLRWQNQSTNKWFQLDGGTSTMNNQYGTHATLGTYATGTDYYAEIKRDGDSVTATIWSGSYGGTVINTQTRDYSSTSPEGLRYLRISNYGADTSGSAGLIGYIKDIEFWNGSATTTQDDKSTITNVPIGSEYQEVDTRKFFQFKEGGGNQVENAFGSDYTWATAGDSGCSITTGNDPSGYGTSAGTLSSYRRAKTAITSGNTKTFVWKFTWSRNSGDQANNSILTLANFDWADSTPSGDQKNIKFQTSNGNVAFWRAQTATESKTNTQNSDFLQATGTTRYYTVTGNGSTWKAQSWSDSDRTTDEETTGNLDFPSDWLTTDAIDNLTFGSFGTASSDFTVKEVSVKWDSGITAEWVERGTAI